MRPAPIVPRAAAPLRPSAYDMPPLSSRDMPPLRGGRDMMPLASRDMAMPARCGKFECEKDVLLQVEWGLPIPAMDLELHAF
eukprot:536674-Pelagomonas_calceolata.AAC.1